ncbi:SchA/CurD-like domain-containing protein [Thermopolyspora sp. NPDC052614]|uniref:SchA/CurD-like domain-containing protein n=1 Tax=Thermopolyspora sp. NPDC052614 TaxID=3155682 RepID=UPI00342F58C7
MPFAAITFRVKPGHEDEISEIFAESPRLDSPIVTDEQGREVARLLGTAAFIKDDVLVRVIHYEGDFAAVGRHLARQRNIHQIEGRLQPYLAETRATQSPDRFAAFFRDALMRCVFHSSPEAEPART